MRRAAVLSLRASVVATLLLLVIACTQGGRESTPPEATPPTPSPAPAVTSPTPTSGTMLAQAIPTPPSRDLIDLARRLGRFEGEVPTQVNSTPPDYRLGQRQDFIILQLPSFGEWETAPPRTETVSAVLRQITPHAYFYVQDGIEVSDSDLGQAGRDLEEIYPRLTEVFGHERSPGIDDDTHITILNAQIDNIGGYFSSDDELPRSVAPLSNEREMVYLGPSIGLPGTPSYTAVLAHELQHLFQFNADEDEEVWVNEGLSEVAGGMVSGSSSEGPAFLDQPDTQLNAWSDGADVSRHYGASDLFFRYLAERTGSPAGPAGGPESLRDFAARPEDGIAGIRAFLKGEKAGFTFEELFADWVVADYLDHYDELEATAAPSATLDEAGAGSDSVHQFAADYIEVELSGGDAVFDFNGDTETPVLPNEPHGGSGQWWANRGDAIDTTLTREIDLSGLSSATLTFWTWYDIERWYDYAYVEASADGGQTWTILRGSHSTDENPVAQAYGPAYTGMSGGGSEPVWVQESVDLTPFAGSRVLLRFEYVTDGGLNEPGWAIDDISVPELGLFDDAESDGDWASNGFVRLDEPLRQQFILRLIEIGDETKVTDVALDEENHAEVRLTGFGDGLRKAVLVIAGATEGTTEPAQYSYSLRALP